MIKQNVVQLGRTPCKSCGGRSTTVEKVGGTVNAYCDADAPTDEKQASAPCDLRDAAETLVDQHQQ
jgi:hypothetical protein